MTTKEQPRKVSDMTEDELRHILKQEFANPLMILAQGIADLKSEAISLTDSKIHCP